MARAATSRLKVNPPLGSPPTLEWRAVGDLLIDATYQREINNGSSQTLIRKIAMYWDWSLCQPLTVSRRLDGSLTIVDGQHRASAAKLRNDIPHLPCVITSYANTGDEAAAFVALNQMRRPLGALDLFKAAVAADDKEALAILKAITDAGLSIAKHRNYIAWYAGEISNIGGIRRFFRTYGEAATRTALTAMGAAWPGEVLRYCGSVFPGIAAVALDEFRLRSDLGQVAADLARIAGQRTQAEWRRAGESYVAVNGGGRQEAMAIVFRAAWRSRNSSSSIVSTDDLPWCSQCERRVAPDKTDRCTDRFCALKKAEAA
jgi:hypothetical protein